MDRGGTGHVGGLAQAASEPSGLGPRGAGHSCLWEDEGSLRTRLRAQSSC